MFRAVLLAVALGAVVIAAEPARPVKLEAAAADDVAKEILKDRADTEAWLKSDITSYLATVYRKDFGPKKTLTVGRAADNDVRIDDAEVSAHHLRVTVDGDRFRVQAVDASARFAVGADDEQREATVDPSSIGVGRFHLRLSHQRFPRDHRVRSEEPALQAYKGLNYFPVDLAYRYELPLTPNPKPETTIILSTRGNRRNAQRVGWFEFVVGTTPSRLEVVRLLEPGVGENDLGIFFRERRRARRATRWAATSTSRSCRMGTTCSTSTSPTTRRAPFRTTTTARSLPRRTP